MTNLEKQIVSLLGFELGQGDIIKFKEDELTIIRITKHYDGYKILVFRDLILHGVTMVDVDSLKSITLLQPHISYLQVVRAKYEVEESKSQISKNEYAWEVFLTQNKFATNLLIDWQGESLAEQTEILKDWIKGELK